MQENYLNKGREWESARKWAIQNTNIWPAEGCGDPSDPVCSVLTFSENLTCFILLVVLERFAGIKPAPTGSRKLRPQLLQITFLLVHQGLELWYLLQTQTVGKEKRREKKGWYKRKCCSASVEKKKNLCVVQKADERMNASPVSRHCSHLSISSRAWSSASGSGGPVGARKR